MFKCVKTINNQIFVYDSQGKRVSSQIPEVQKYLKRADTKCVSSSSLQLIEARQDKNDLLHLVQMAKEESMNAELLQHLLAKTLDTTNTYSVPELKQVYLAKQNLNQQLEKSGSKNEAVAQLMNQLQTDMKELKQLIIKQKSESSLAPSTAVDVVKKAVDFTNLQKDYDNIKQQLQTKLDQIGSMQQNIDLLNRQVQSLYPALSVSSSSSTGPSKIIPSYFGAPSKTEITEETAQQVLKLQESNELLLKQLNEESDEVLRLTKKQNELTDELQKYKTFLSLEQQKSLESAKFQKDLLAELQSKNENLTTQLSLVQTNYEQIKALSDLQMEQIEQNIQRIQLLESNHENQLSQLQEVQQVNDQYEILFNNFNQCVNTSQNIQECLRGILVQASPGKKSVSSEVALDSPLPSFDSQGVLRNIGQLSTGPKIPISRQSSRQSTPQKRSGGFIDLSDLGDLEEDELPSLENFEDDFLV
jgi:hypothetical protein